MEINYNRVWCFVFSSSRLCYLCLRLHLKSRITFLPFSLSRCLLLVLLSLSGPVTLALSPLKSCSTFNISCSHGQRKRPTMPVSVMRNVLSCWSSDNKFQPAVNSDVIEGEKNHGRDLSFGGWGIDQKAAVCSVKHSDSDECTIKSTGLGEILWCQCCSESVKKKEKAPVRDLNFRFTFGLSEAIEW